MHTCLHFDSVQCDCALKDLNDDFPCRGMLFVLAKDDCFNRTNLLKVSELNIVFSCKKKKIWLITWHVT